MLRRNVNVWGWCLVACVFVLLTGCGAPSGPSASDPLLEARVTGVIANWEAWHGSVGSLDAYQCDYWALLDLINDDTFDGNIDDYCWVNPDAVIFDITDHGQFEFVLPDLKRLGHAPQEDVTFCGQLVLLTTVDYFDVSTVPPTSWETLRAAHRTRPQKASHTYWLAYTEVTYPRLVCHPQGGEFQGHVDFDLHFKRGWNLLAHQRYDLVDGVYTRGTIRTLPFEELHSVPWVLEVIPEASADNRTALR